MEAIPCQRLAWLLLGGLIGLAGCQQNDANKLQRVACKAAEKVQAAAGMAQEPVLSGWQMVRTNLDDMSPEGRVLARLRWDKLLASSPITVKAIGGIVELKGSVPTEELKRHAVNLAQTTVGVEKVSDSLEVTGQ
jgi:osmotically-inducible protein OsmY